MSCQKAPRAAFSRQLAAREATVKKAGERAARELGDDDAWCAPLGTAHVWRLRLLRAPQTALGASTLPGGKGWGLGARSLPQMLSGARASHL